MKSKAHFNPLFDGPINTSSTWDVIGRNGRNIGIIVRNPKDKDKHWGFRPVNFQTVGISQETLIIIVDFLQSLNGTKKVENEEEFCIKCFRLKEEGKCGCE